MAKEAERINVAWNRVKDEFLKRVEFIFGVKCPFESIRVFLTTDGRCSYNISQGYFFVSVSRPFQDKTCMHELLHFWTWWLFHEEVESGRMTTSCYNDVKESLTELLNIEFQDLLDGIPDEGYPQHQAMRAMIRREWGATRDIKKVFVVASKMCSTGK